MLYARAVGSPLLTYFHFNRVDRVLRLLVLLRSLDSTCWGPACTFVTTVPFPLSEYSRLLVSQGTSQPYENKSTSMSPVRSTLGIKLRATACLPAHAAWYHHPSNIRTPVSMLQSTTLRVCEDRSLFLGWETISVPQDASSECYVLWWSLNVESHAQLE